MAESPRDRVGFGAKNLEWVLATFSRKGVYSDCLKNLKK
jgi:hypothetical protein